MKKFNYLALLVIFCLPFANQLVADDDDDDDIRYFQDHAPPFEFVFGNRIDTHLENKLRKNGDLKGYFYIRWEDADEDGVVDIDPVNGLPRARHCNANTDPSVCFAGWKVKGKPCIPAYNQCAAAFIYHAKDHPYWLIGESATIDSDGDGYAGPGLEDDMGRLKGNRTVLPQPFGTGHYHWLTEGTTADGVDFPSSLNPSYPAVLPVDLAPGVIDSPLEQTLGVAIDVPDDCNVPMAGALAPPGVVCPGYFLQIKAIETFSFHHGGEWMPVRPGIDIETHHNILSSYQAVVLTDAGGGDDGEGHH